jgi:hypothetical protein
MRKQLFFLVSTILCVISSQLDCQVNIFLKNSTGMLTKAVYVSYKDSRYTGDKQLQKIGTQSGGYGLIAPLANIVSSTIDWEAISQTGAKTQGSISVPAMKQKAAEYPNYDQVIEFTTDYFNNPKYTISFIEASGRPATPVPPVGPKKAAPGSPWLAFPAMGGYEGKDWRDLDPAGKRTQALKVFGLPENATMEQIKSAYKTLSRQWHPDKHKDDPYYTAVFQIIGQAYTNLGGN